MIFTYAQVSNLNETEMIVYKYIIKNANRVVNMSIRELAAESHVSTATINRFCHHLDCDGYAEFKVQLKLFIEKNKIPQVNDELKMLEDFFNYTKKEEFQNKINDAVQLVENSDFIVFLGIGQSGSIAKYAARYFSNVGYFSQYIDDPFYPAPTSQYENCLLVAFSNSGETKEVIDQLKLYQSAQSKILAIVNEADSTIGKMSDVVISYYTKKIILPSTKNISSQVPAVYIIERIARHLNGEYLTNIHS